MEDKKDVSLLDFASCGNREDFLKMIDYLAKIAEPEKWSFDDNPDTILIKYIQGTFKQCYKQNKILYTEDKNFS